MLINMQKQKTEDKRIAIRMIVVFIYCFMVMFFSVQAHAEETFEGNFYHKVTMISGEETSAFNLKARSTYSIVGDAYQDSLTSENEKRIYDVLVSHNNQEGMKKYSIDSNNGMVVQLKTPVYIPKINAYQSYAWKQLQKQFSKAVDAFIFDYSENYWIAGFSCNYQGVSSDTKWKLSQITLFPVDYYPGIRNEMSSTEQVLQKIINGVKGNSRYEIVKNAHDTVAQWIIYPQNMDLYSNMYLHTITGPLLGKYNHYGVCDAYARLFRLICQAKNIPCILVPGGSQEKNGKVISNHIWNYVKMEDGKWYLVDVTWDDQNSDPYEYFLAGEDTTAQDHRPVGVFSEESMYTSFRIPSLSQKAYERPLEQENQKIENTEIQKINLGTSSLTMTCETEKMMRISLVPSNAAGYHLEFESSNPEIVSVNTAGGYLFPVFTAKKTGTANILVKNTSSSKTISVYCKVTVKHNPVVKTIAATAFKEGSRITYCAGCHKQLKKEILPKCRVTLNIAQLPLQLKKTSTALRIKTYTPGDQVVSWTSSDSKIVTVNSAGKLTAKKKGNAVVTVTMRSGASASCRILVQKGKVKTTQLAAAKTVIILKNGKTENLTITKLPLTSQEKITYKSQNRKVATVNSKGKITAKKRGVTYITVKSGKKKLKIKVVVE